MALPSAHTNNFVVPKGRVYLKNLTQGESNYRYIGANQSATLTKELETIELRSAESGLGELLDQQITNVTYNLALMIADISLDNLSLFINGQQYTVTQASGSVVDEEIIATKGRLYQLGESLATPTGAKSISAVTVENQTGADATAWQATTAYILDDYAVPTVANGHFYKVTVAGTSGASEPTWPTDGSTVVDGTVTWQDQGLIALVAGTDYELDAVLGQIFIKATAPNVIETDTYYVGYTKAAATIYQVQSSSVVDYYSVRVVTDNPVGTNKEWYFPKCQLQASGDLILKSDESQYQQFEIGVSILVPDTGESQVYVDNRPI